MSSTILSFLSHGGIKLLIIGFFLVMRVVRSNASKAKKRDAQLRGNTGINDFSSPEPKPAAQAPPPPLAQPVPTLNKTASKPPTSSLGSPWSSNQNPFDDKKS